MFMLIALRTQNTAAGIVTGSIAFARKRTVQHAAPRRRVADVSAQRSVGAAIGRGERVSATRSAGVRIGSGNLRSCRNWAASAFPAAIQICAYSTSTTLTRRLRTSQRTGNTPPASVSFYGSARWVICKSYAPTATASKHIPSIGGHKTFSRLNSKYFDISCRRIEEAYRQPRLFEEPAPKPVQTNLLDGDAA